MTPGPAIREIFLAVVLVAFGLIGLPPLILLVGQVLIGDYAQGLPGFYEALAGALAGGHVFAWLLVLSPYLTVQLIRGWNRLGPRQSGVK